MSSTAPRRPAGTPSGGQFAAATHTEADVALNDHASELALRILQSGTVGPWRIRDRDLLGPRNLVTYDVVPEGITMADAVEGSNAHRQLTTAVADLTEAAEEEWFEELAQADEPPAPPTLGA